MPARTVSIDPVTRIEGHARVTIDLDDQDQILRARLQVLEFRGFEKLVEGMELAKMPLVTARICGVCPAAHHLAAVRAIESGLGVEPPPAAALLRELLYCGHILHSHAVSTFALAGPDLLAGLGAPPDQRNLLALLRVDAELAKKALRLRSIGQRVVEIVGGRGVHPVTAVPGGMATAPEPERLDNIAAWGREAVGLVDELAPRIREALGRLAELAPALPLPAAALALSRGGRHAWLSGDWVLQQQGAAPERLFSECDYASALVEHASAASYMKAVRLRAGDRVFHVGPLARLLANERMGTPRADAALSAFREQHRTSLSALDEIDARLIEMLHAAERLVEIPPEVAGAHELLRPVPAPVAGTFIAAVEAPRGLLVHHYVTGPDGRITRANLVVATQNNQDAIDGAITGVARQLAPRRDDALLMHGVELALRCFDPCLACATHAGGAMPMHLVLRRGGAVVRTVVRQEEEP